MVIVSRTTIYDVHVRFRVSNALVDVSARTHTTPGGREEALVRELARVIAQHLGG